MSDIREKPVLDLEIYHSKRNLAGLVLYLTWYYDADEKEHLPGMVIMKENHKSVPFIIPLSNVHLYEDPGSGHKELLRAATLCNQALLQSDTMTNVYKIAELINGSLYDIITMPPYPDSQRQVVADVIVTNHLGKTIETEVTE